MNATDESNQTPLHLAAMIGDYDTVVTVLDFGADVDARDNEGDTPLHLAAMAGYGPIVELLIDGLQSDDTYIQNISALHLGRLGAFASTALSALNDFVESNTDPTDGTRRPVLAAENAIKRINGT